MTRYYYSLLFGLTIAFGSIVLSLLGSAFLHHEINMWGLAWSVVFVWALVHFLYSKTVDPKLLFVLSISCGFTLLSRAAMALAPLITLAFLLFVVIVAIRENSGNVEKSNGFLDWLQWSKESIKSSQIKPIIIAAFLPIILCVAFQLKINYERWRDPFEFFPMKYYGFMLRETERYKRVQENGVHNLSRIPKAFVFYFIPASQHFSNKFPYLEISSDHDLFRSLKPIHVDNLEPANPFPLNSLYLFCMAIIGFFALNQVYNNLGKVVVLLFFVASVYSLSVLVMSLRYEADYIPFFLLLSFPSFNVLMGFESKGKVFCKMARFFLLVLALVSIYTASSTLAKYKLWLWPVPESCKQNIIVFFNKTDLSLKETLYKKIFKVNKRN